MRTTIEIRDAHRAELLRLAADRGEKGFSRIVEEAIEQYLASHHSRMDKVSAALACFGSLTEPQAERLRSAATHARERWR